MRKVVVSFFVSDEDTEGLTNSGVATALRARLNATFEPITITELRLSVHSENPAPGRAVSLAHADSY